VAAGGDLRAIFRKLGQRVTAFVHQLSSRRATEQVDERHAWDGSRLAVHRPDGSGTLSLMIDCGFYCEILRTEKKTSQRQKPRNDM
jgi:hypothetical protein